MSTILSKLWPGLSIAIIALMAFLWLRSCNKTAPVPDVSGQIAAAKKAGSDSAQRVDSPVIVLLTRQKDSLSVALDSVIADLVNAQSDLEGRAGDISRTLASGDQARVQHDTVRIIQNCDSLEAQVKAGIPAVGGYVLLTDSLIKATVDKSVIQDSIIAKLQRDNAFAGATITAQQLAYDIIHKDDATKTAQLKIYRPVAIGGVAIVAAIIVLKFILK